MRHWLHELGWELEAEAMAKADAIGHQISP
jgi:hypothetical protein